MKQNNKSPTNLQLGKYRGTSMPINAFRNSWQVPKPTGTKQATSDDEAFSFGGGGGVWQGAVVWLIQVLSSASSPEQVRSAETLFSHQNVVSTGFDEFRGTTVC